MALRNPTASSDVQLKTKVIALGTRTDTLEETIQQLTARIAALELLVPGNTQQLKLAKESIDEVSIEVGRIEAAMEKQDEVLAELLNAGASFGAARDDEDADHEDAGNDADEDEQARYLRARNAVPVRVSMRALPATHR